MLQLKIFEPKKRRSELKNIEQIAKEESRRKHAAIQKKRDEEAARRRGYFKGLPTTEKAKVIGGKVVHVAGAVKSHVNLGKDFGTKAAYSMGRGLGAVRYGYSAADIKPKKARRRRGRKAANRPRVVYRTTPAKQPNRKTKRYDPWDDF